MPRLLLAMLAALLGSVAIAAPASASEWRSATFPELGTTGLFLDVDCPSENLCVAAGSDDAIASSTEPAAGLGHWRLGHVSEPGAYGPLPEATEDAPALVLPGAQIRGVSCPTTDLCVAVTRLGGILTSTEPEAGAAAWSGFHLQAEGPRTHLYDVSCPTTGLCVAVALGGKVLVSTNPLGGPPAWSLIQLPETLELQGVSCSSPTQCLAVGKEGAIVSSSNPTGGAAAWKVVHEPAYGELQGVSCPAADLCLTGNRGAVLSTRSPGGDASAFSTAAGVTPLQLTAFDCAGEEACAAVNDNADVFTSTEPAGPVGAWSVVNIVPFNEPNGTFGISCPSLDLCVAVGTHYLIASSTDPFEGPAAKPSPSQRRPTVRITHHPPRVIHTHRPRVRVGFRFREIGLRDGFLCKLGTKQFRPCSSPRRYRVGPGRHVFAVKVADPGGPDQTTTRFRFRVIRLHGRR